MNLRFNSIRNGIRNSTCIIGGKITPIFFLKKTWSTGSEKHRGKTTCIWTLMGPVLQFNKNLTVDIRPVLQCIYYHENNIWQGAGEIKRGSLKTTCETDSESYFSSTNLYMEAALTCKEITGMLLLAMVTSRFTGTDRTKHSWAGIR